MADVAVHEGQVDVPGRPSAARARSGDRMLALGLVLIACAGMALASMHLSAKPLSTDEPTIVVRALAVAQGSLQPPAYDYPPLPAYLLGGVLRLTALVQPDVLTDDLAPYLVGRRFFIALTGLVIAGSGLLAAQLIDPAQRRRRRVAAFGTAASLAVSYLLLRLGSISKPDALQLVFMVGCGLASVRYVRRADVRFLLLAGACAGLAAAAKYVGVLAGVPVGVAALLWAGPWSRRLLHGGALTAATVGAFLLGTLGTVVTDFRAFADGFATEFAHQASGHLGYEPESTGWWFHATTSLPGNWGWPLTVVAFAGVGWAALRAGRADRLVAGTAVLLFAVAGTSSVQFPHYVLLALPFLAVLAWTAATALGASRLTAVAVVGVLLLLAPAADAVRLTRAWGSSDTRAAAAAVQAELALPLHVEQYTGRPFDAASERFAFGFEPEILACDCVVAVSSYQEERFRNRPDLYPDEIAVYDAIRERGRVLAAIGPDVALSYRWDLLPQWGAGNLPLFGPVGPTGPTITIVDLREAVTAAGDGRPREAGGAARS